MGRRERAKGQRGEREFAGVVNERFPWLDVRRSAGQSRKGDDAPDLVGWPGVHFEVKRTEREQPRKALEQAIGDSKGSIPIAVLRPSRKEWIAVVRAEDLLDVLEMAGLVPSPPDCELGAPCDCEEERGE